MEQKEKECLEDNVKLEDILNSMPEEEADDCGSSSPELFDNTEEIAESENELENSSAEYQENDIESCDEIEDYPEDDDEDYEEVRPVKKKKRKKRGHGHIIFGLIFSVIIISVSILAAAVILKCAKEFLGIGKSDIEIVIDIPMNSSTLDIAEQLYNEGIIADTSLFRLFSKLKGADGTFIAGTHKVSPKMDYSTLIEILQEESENKRETADVVFPEGITLMDAAKRLEEKGVCNAEEFIDAFNSSAFGFDFEEKVVISPMKFYKMEGYLFPDTYQFYLEEDPRVVAKKICKNFEARITPDLYGRMEDLDMELEEVLTLASIVQAEAANTRDMKKVASVFYNRLNNPNEYPLLQSDPTTNYVEEVIIPYSKVQTEKVNIAYDTYKGAGLTPGPICNPGLDAIEAVLYPEDTDYYYFCSNLETGEFFYAETLEEHEQNLVTAGLVK